MKRIISNTVILTSLLLGTTTLLVADDAKIDIKGSDTLGAKLVPQLKNAYIKAHPAVKIDILAQGSSHAFSNLDAGTADIGMSSRKVKQQELDKFEAKGKALVEHIAAWDMIAVIVNEMNPVRKLSLKQIEGIFTGTITNWAEVGGADAPISVYTRNTSSGTYKSFSKLAMSKKDYGTNCQKLEGNQPIVTEVAKNTNGIGYVGYAYAKGDDFKTVKVEGVSAKVSKIAKYPLARKLFYYTVGEPSGDVAKFLEWATSSDTASDIVAEIGFIPTPVAQKAMGTLTK
jgi:phosphate transport system substrate-binding protein